MHSTCEVVTLRKMVDWFDAKDKYLCTAQKDPQDAPCYIVLSTPGRIQHSVELRSEQSNLLELVTVELTCNAVLIALTLIDETLIVFCRAIAGA